MTVPAARRGDPWVALVVALWVGGGLWLDHAAPLEGQRLIGVVTWAALALALWRESRAARVQVLVALAIATAGEYALAPGLGLYAYRFEGVPSFVPPGHGLVYLAALNLARSTLAGRWGPALRRLSIVAGGAWAVWGITGAARNDRFGFVLYLAWAAFALRGGAPMIAVGCWLLTTWLELLGTALGNWAWAPATALPFLTMGNPPTGIAGGYCVLDVLALRIGGALARRRVVQRPREPSGGGVPIVKSPSATNPESAAGAATAGS